LVNDAAEAVESRVLISAVAVGVRIARLFDVRQVDAGLRMIALNKCP
jgi:hypothetical protein